MNEIAHRKFITDPSQLPFGDLNWYSRVYRGKNLPKSTLHEVGTYVNSGNRMVYKEHDDKYLKECLLSLKSKGAELVNGKTIDEMLIELDLKGNTK